GPPEARGERLATPASIIGEQHGRAFLLIQRLKTIDERRERLRTFAGGERVDFVCGRLEALGQILERSGTDAPDLIERTVAGNGRHPGERRAPGGVEVSGLFPDAHVSLLKRVRAQVPSGK